MGNRHELTDERIQGLLGNNFCMPVESTDLRGSETTDFEPSGVLYVMQPSDKIPFHKFEPAKIGDVGHDIPTRIKHMQDAVETTVRVQPYREYYINWEAGWVDIPPHGYAELPSNIYTKVPWDSWGLIKNRSSTGWKKHLFVFEGTIDSSYVGHLCCLVHNPHQEPIRIVDGERLSQLILVPRYPLKRVAYVNRLPKTGRGESGFGSTG